MPSADIAYHRPSRGARALIVLLSLGVVALAAWVVTSNLATLYAGASPAAIEEEAVQIAAAQAPAAEPIAAADDLAAAEDDVAAAESVEPTEQAAAASAPWPEPIVVASVQDPPMAAPEPTLGSVLDPETTEGVGDAVARLDDLVPLPPKRPRASAIPVPRPRPDGAGEPEPVGRILTEAEIARMQ